MNNDLNPQKLKIEDRSIQQLLQDMLKTYAQIPFEENGVEVGKWDALFKNQLLFFWVEIHEIDLLWWQKERDIIIKNWDAHGYASAAAYIKKLTHTFYTWFIQSETYLQYWIISELESCLESVNFQMLEGTVAQMPDNEQTLKEVQHLKSRVKNKRTHNEAYFNKKSEVDQFEHLTNLSLNCLLQIQRELKGRNWDELVSTERFPPHVGLVYGFLKAYEKIKTQINELPQRHLDFYYKKVLHQGKAKAKPDQVYLFFQLDPKQENYVLPKATVLLGAPDENGNETEYETITNAYLTNAKISELRTLLIHSSKDIAPLNRISGVTGLYNRAISSEIATEYSPEERTWGFFGEDIVEDIASIGWAWSSPAFYSYGGKRSYELTFEFTKTSAADCRELIEEISTADYLSKEELFHAFFSDAFLIRITTPDGWLSIDRYTVNFLNFLKGTTDSIQINFTLLNSNESWTRYVKDTHGGNYQSIDPLIEFRIKGDTVYYPYSFLRGMEIKSLGIAVSVQNLKNLVLYNKHGLIDSTSPFPIFGVNPLKNDEFSIGSLEWMNKNVQSLDLKFNWLTLPKPNFTDYYKDYQTLSIQDSDIKISVSESLDKKEHQLFSLNEDQELVESSALENLSIYKKAKTERRIEVLSPLEKPSAFVNLKLISPEEGLGSNHYNEELILYSQQKARDRKNKLDLLPPKAPFIPYVKNLSVNYQSYNVIDTKAINNGYMSEVFDLYHIHPHGVHKVADENRITEKKLVPYLEDRAYLYLGFEDLLVGSVLGIYVKLEKSSEDVDGEVKFKLEYLGGKTWFELNQDDILENSIEKNLSSGMLTFIVPIDIANKHPLYTSDKEWIRISVESKYAGLIGKCSLIRPNGCLAQRLNIDSGEKIELAPPETIVSFKSKPKGIASLSQPIPSYGGKEAEEEHEVYNRVSHYLSHKGRMVRPRDYRRMLFQEFDNLAWIKVATASQYPESVKAGEVHIIVLPTFMNIEDLKQLSLRSEQIEVLKNYITRYSAPGIEIKIFSPQIEFVEVCVDIILNRLVTTPSLEEISELIDRTISPWAYSDGKIENVDDSFNTIDVLNELNKLPSVWKVEVCEAVQIIKQGSHYNYIDSAEGSDLLKPSTYKSILVPIMKHKIRFITKPEESKEDTTIGNMIIGTDLIVRAKSNIKKAEEVSNDSNKSLFLISTENEKF